MGDRFCPICNGSMHLRDDETYNYDPLVSVEVIMYSCSSCAYEESIEILKQLYE